VVGAGHEDSPGRTLFGGARSDAAGADEKPAVTGFYQMIWNALGAPGQPSPKLDFHEMLTEDPLYCCRFTMSGVQNGEFMGTPASGKPYASAGITIMRFQGDRVVERWSSADFLGDDGAAQRNPRTAAAAGRASAGGRQPVIVSVRHPRRRRAPGRR
jgi:predicted ester cyclase